MVTYVVRIQEAAPAFMKKRMAQMPMDLVLGRTLIGRQLINEGKIKIKDGASKKDVDDFVQVISYAGDVSIQAYAYMNRMLSFEPGSKVNGLKQPGYIEIDLVRDDDSVFADSYARGRVDIGDMMGQPDGKDLFRGMNVIVESGGKPRDS